MSNIKQKRLPTRPRSRRSRSPSYKRDRSISMSRSRSRSPSSSPSRSRSRSPSSSPSRSRSRSPFSSPSSRPSRSLVSEQILKPCNKIKSPQDCILSKDVNGLGNCYFDSSCKKLDYDLYKTVKQYKYLVGPFRYREYISEKYDKHIILIGDYHVVEPKCKDEIYPNTHISIYDLLLMTFRNTKETIDFFIETEFQRGDPRKVSLFHNCYLKNIQILFESCLRINKEECPFQKVRFHYVDVRDYGALEFLVGFFHTFQKQENIDLLKRYKNKIYRAYYALLYPYKNSIKEFLDLILNSLILLKII